MLHAKTICFVLFALLLAPLKVAASKDKDMDNALLACWLGTMQDPYEHFVQKECEAYCQECTSTVCLSCSLGTTILDPVTATQACLACNAILCIMHGCRYWHKAPPRDRNGLLQKKRDHMRSDIESIMVARTKRTEKSDKIE